MTDSEREKGVSEFPVHKQMQPEPEIVRFRHNGVLDKTNMIRWAYCLNCETWIPLYCLYYNRTWHITKTGGCGGAHVHEIKD